jgi:hypothetical protein
MNFGDAKRAFSSECESVIAHAGSCQVTPVLHALARHTSVELTRIAHWHALLLRLSRPLPNSLELSLSASLVWVCVNLVTQPTIETRRTRIGVSLIEPLSGVNGIQSMGVDSDDHKAPQRKARSKPPPSSIATSGSSASSVLSRSSGQKRKR